MLLATVPCQGVLSAVFCLLNNSVVFYAVVWFGLGFFPYDIASLP